MLYRRWTRVRIRQIALIAGLLWLCSSPNVVHSQQTPAAPVSGSARNAFVDPGAPSPDQPAGRREAGPAPYAERRQPWLLGEMLYGREYAGTIALTNLCATEQQFGVFAYGLPGLTIAPSVTLPAGETARLPYLLMPRQRPSGITETLAGELVIWRPGSGTACPPLRVVHVAHGRLRTATPADEQAETNALQDAAMRAACVHWWLDGETPGAQALEALPAAARPGASRAEATTCAEVVRPAARNLRQRLADGTAGLPPQAWLPDAAAIDRMSLPELIAFRQRVVEARAAAKEK